MPDETLRLQARVDATARAVLWDFSEESGATYLQKFRRRNPTIGMISTSGDLLGGANGSYSGAGNRRGRSLLTLDGFGGWRIIYKSGSGSYQFGPGGHRYSYSGDIEVRCSRVSFMYSL